jgi:hypothetical protein
MYVRSNKATEKRSEGLFYPRWGINVMVIVLGDFLENQSYDKFSLP